MWPHINYEDSLVMKLRGKVKDSNEIGMHFFTIVQQALLTYWPTQVYLTSNKQAFESSNTAKQTTKLFVIL